LTEILSDQRLIQHNDTIARKLADMVKVEELPETKQLYIRGEAGKNCLFFILSGSIDLLIQDKHIATLEPGQFVGEFPILNASLDYDVSVVAREKSVIASVPEHQFLSVTMDYPEIWKNMAKELATRLRKVNTAKQQMDAMCAIKPEELTIWTILKSLTVQQSWIIIVTIFTVLSTVAATAYTMGATKLLG
jgi:CRP-like cAMP-binding protein